MHLSKRIVEIICAALLLTACASNYNRIETGGTERTNVRLDDSVAVLITTPRDGGTGTKFYSGSGAIAARTIDAAFSRSARLVDVYPLEYHSLDELQDVISRNGYGYIVVPKIVLWGQKDSEWSKIPNQVRVKITVIDATTGRELSSNFLESKNESPSIYDVFASDDEGPEELLSDMADDYVDDLYGVLLSFPVR